MRFRALALLLLCASTALLAPITAAANPGYSVSGNLEPISGPSAWAGTSIKWFDKSPALAKLVDPSYYVLRPGLDGQATFTLEAWSTTPVAAVEVAIDRANGNQLIAVGTTTQAGPSSGTTASATSAIGAVTSSGTSTATSFRSAHYYTEWDDPFWIPVSTVQTNINWYYGGGSVTSFTGSDYRTWFSPNGWHEIYHLLSSYWDRTETRGNVSTQDKTQTSSWFPVPSCGTSTIYYFSNIVTGWPDGHGSGSVNTWVNSGCAYLLGWNAGFGYN